MLIDLSAAFDTVSHQILCDIMERSFGVSSVALDWLDSYLHPRAQQIIINDTKSDRFILEQGVPQGSCLGPVLFTGYSSSVFEVINQSDMHGHGYADDHQIYVGFHPSDLQDAKTSMEHCIAEIRHWMKSMRLKVNDSKTEYILLGTPQQLSLIHI